MQPFPLIHILWPPNGPRYHRHRLILHIISSARVWYVDCIASPSTLGIVIVIIRFIMRWSSITLPGMRGVAGSGSSRVNNTFTFSVSCSLAMPGQATTAGVVKLTRLFPPLTIRLNFLSNQFTFSFFFFLFVFFFIDVKITTKIMRCYAAREQWQWVPTTSIEKTAQTDKRCSTIL